MFTSVTEKAVGDPKNPKKKITRKFPAHPISQ
jgi:hypothetical protein